MHSRTSDAVRFAAAQEHDDRKISVMWLAVPAFAAWVALVWWAL
jgi:hypothetical protein